MELLMQRNPPLRSTERAPCPTVPLDHAVMRVMQDGTARQLVSIRRDVGLPVSTHDLYARVRTLVDKGLLIRTPLPGGPRRGPGASEYSLAPLGTASL